MSYSDKQAGKIINNIESSLSIKRDGDKLKIIDLDGKKVGTIKGDVTEKKIRTILGMKDGGSVKKMKDGGSQSTGSFFGDLKKAISSGGSSKLTKKVDVKKNDTLSSIAKKHNTTIAMLQKLNSGLKSADSQKTMEFNADTLKVPDPQSFQGGRLKPVRTKKKKDPYEGQTKADMAEMNRPIMDKASLKRQQKKVKDTPDINKKAGGTIRKMNMGGVMKARGGTFKGTY